MMKTKKVRTAIGTALVMLMAAAFCFAISVKTTRNPVRANEYTPADAYENIYVQDFEAPLYRQFTGHTPDNNGYGTFANLDSLALFVNTSVPGSSVDATAIKMGYTLSGKGFTSFFVPGFPFENASYEIDINFKVTGNIVNFGINLGYNGGHSINERSAQWTDLGEGWNNYKTIVDNGAYNDTGANNFRCWYDTGSNVNNYVLISKLEVRKATPEVKVCTFVCVDQDCPEHGDAVCNDDPCEDTECPVHGENTECTGICADADCPVHGTDIGPDYTFGNNLLPGFPVVDSYRTSHWYEMRTNTGLPFDGWHSFYLDNNVEILKDPDNSENQLLKMWNILNKPWTNVEMRSFSTTINSSYKVSFRFKLSDESFAGMFGIAFTGAGGSFVEYNVMNYRDNWTAVDGKPGWYDFELDINAIGVNDGWRFFFDTAFGTGGHAVFIDDLSIQRKVNKDALRSLVDVVKDLTEEDFTAGSWSASGAQLGTDLTAAIAALESATVTQAQVNTARTQLNTTYTGMIRAYTVTFAVVNGNGSISATAGAASIVSGGGVQSGSSLVFTATPEEGYRVKEWKVGGVAVAENKTNTLSITSEAKALSVTVEFERLFVVTFSVTGANGTLTAAAGQEITSGNEVLEGSQIIFTATPEEGYRVKEWKVGGVIVSGNTSYNYTHENLAGAITVTVEFELIPAGTFAVAFSVAGANGTLAATVDSTAILNGNAVELGKNVIFTATPAQGFRVKEWKLNGTVVTGNTSNSYTHQNLTGAITVTVEFVAIKHIVTFNVTGSNGTLTAAVNTVAVTSGNEVEEGRSVVFTAAPAQGFRVKEWKLNSTVVTGNTSNSYTHQNLTGAVTVTVEFERIPAPTFTVTFSVAGSNGTITAKVDGTAITSGDAVEEGKSIVFTATPAQGYRVKGWTAAGTAVLGNTSETYTRANLSGALIVKVEFEQIPVTTYVVTFSITGSNGTLTASVDGTAITSGSSVATGKSVVFTAAAAEGYRVKAWTADGVTVEGNTTGTYTHTLSGAVVVSIEFEAIPDDSPEPPQKSCGNNAVTMNITTLFIAVLAVMFIRKRGR